MNPRLKRRRSINFSVRGSPQTVHRKESDVIREILNFLKMQGIFAWRNNTMGTPLKGGGFRPAQMKGVSDILGILPGGKFLAIEVKTLGYSTLTPDQANFMMEVTNHGGKAFVALGIEGVARDLAEHIKDYVWNG